jgi:LacI family transcriptional regulator
VADARATIAGIADELGVSVPTISKVLNGRPDVAPATRVRVEEALNRHSYRRRVSRQAVPGAGLLEVAFHEAHSPWSLEIIHGIQSVCGPARIGLLLSDLSGSHRPKQAWIDDVMARKPVGVLFVLSGPDDVQQQQLRSRSVPFVVVDTQGEPQPGVPTVGSNNWGGALSATRHLIGLGHRRLAVISGPSDVLCSRARVGGFRTAHEEAGLRADPTLVRWGDFEAASGYRHALDLLSQEDPPTGIFAGSDMQALGVIRAARQLGLRVPEDLSVVGYDNLPLTEWTNPPLTTVTQPLREMGALGAQILMALARGEQAGTQSLQLGTQLVERGSTAPPSR